MTKIFPSTKRISKPVSVFFFLFFFLIVVDVFWLINRSPSAESVFWKTLDNNLNSQSVVLETKVNVDLGGEEQKTLLDTQTSLSFAHQSGANLNQKLLLYDKDIAEIYVDPLQLESYQSIGIENPPPQEWHKQEVYSFDNTIYARHDIYTQPAQADWNKAFNVYFTGLPLGGEWHKKEIQSGLAADFQHFLMTSMVNGGIFLYGKTEPQARERITAKLRNAYEVDFENVESFHRNGRLVYEYEVKLDYQQFGIAFIDYFNTNIADEEQREKMTDEKAATIFSNRINPDIITYTVLIDAWSRQLLEVKNPFNFAVGIIYNDIDSQDFVVIPYFTPMGRDLLLNTDLKIDVTTRVLSQNQRLSLEPPQTYINLNIENQESE